MSRLPNKEVYITYVSDAWVSLQADRRTNIREYLKENPDIMQEKLPPDLAERYGG